MQIHGLTWEQIEAAAERAGVRARGDAMHCTIRTKPGKPPQWRKIGSTGRTVPGAVCWHGHRAFMREVFAIEPNARIKSCLADYRGKDNFEATHAATWHPGNRVPHGWSGDVELSLTQPAECDCGA